MAYGNGKSPREQKMEEFQNAYMGQMKQTSDKADATLQFNIMMGNIQDPSPTEEEEENNEQ